MNHLVNGIEMELPMEADLHTEWCGDRWMIRACGEVHSAVSVRQGDLTWVSYRGRVYEVARAGLQRASGNTAHSGESRAPMPGLVVDVLVAKGQAVEPGQKLLVLEAMKTQQTVLAAIAGTVAKLPVVQGQQVVEGDLLVSIEPVTESP